MNVKNLNEMADYLDRGQFGGKGFSMGAYHDCVLGHCAARELERAGKPATVESIGLEINGLAPRVFGITQSADTESWTFAFGAQWGDDYHAAADRLRYLALHGGAPSRDQWDSFRTHPQPVVQAEQEPEEAIAV